ncbi:methyltransferase [Synergistales bacterium]|nr:methyltransferase [Synergistales bacterium]
MNTTSISEKNNAENKLDLEFIAPSELIPYANNARIHPESQIKRLMGSLLEYGLVIPILIDDRNVILAGHGVTEAALRIGLDAVPCVRASHLSEAQRRAFVLAANRLAEDSNWDMEIVKAEMLRLRDDFGVDLDKTGFTRREIVRLRLDQAGGFSDEDTVPDSSGEPVSLPGDIWQLGGHRIICGDSTDARIVERLYDGARPHLMVTDPPYGVKYDPSWRNEVKKSQSKRTGVVLNDHIDNWQDAWELFPGDVAYVWHAALHGESVSRSLCDCGFLIRAQIVWVKPNLVLGRGDYHWKHEPCWYAVREQRKSHWTGDRKSSTVWDIDFSGQDANTVHGTQKPVECMRRPMLNNSEPGELIYEPFCGSGTAIIAAQSIKRVCYAVELNPEYVDMAVRRWQDYTSCSAVLAESEETFDCIAKERVKKT